MERRFYERACLLRRVQVRIRSVVASLGFLVLADLLMGHPRVAHAQQMGGTYRLFICQDASCITNNKHLVARGVLVLTDTSFSYAQLSARIGPQLGSTFVPEPLNGCFAWRRMGRHPSSLAGMDRIGAVIWRRATRDSIEIMLHRTPDASYTVALMRVANDTLRGIGTSHLAGIPPDSIPVDTVTVIMLGPVWLQSCSRG